MSRLLFASLLGAAVATYTETDKAKGVYNYLITEYQGDCFTSSVTGHDFKELGQCMPDYNGVAYYRMGEANATHYIGKKYTDAACTTEVVGAPIDIKGPQCPGDGSSGQTGNRSETTGTQFSQVFSTADCSDTPSFFAYHGGDVCEPRFSEGVLTDYKMQKIQGQGGNMKESIYPSATCTGTASSTKDFVGNGVCTSHPDEENSPGVYYRAWFWYPSGGGVASGAEKLPSPTIPLLVGFAALGRLWTQ